MAAFLKNTARKLSSQKSELTEVYRQLQALHNPGGSVPQALPADFQSSSSAPAPRATPKTRWRRALLGSGRGGLTRTAKPASWRTEWRGLKSKSRFTSQFLRDQKRSLRRSLKKAQAKVKQLRKKSIAASQRFASASDSSWK